MIWFVVPGAVVVALTLLLAILLAVRKCVRSCCASRRYLTLPSTHRTAPTHHITRRTHLDMTTRNTTANREHEDSDDFDSFPTPEYRGGPVRRHRRTPTWVRCVHALTFLLMLAAMYDPPDLCLFPLLAPLVLFVAPLTLLSLFVLRSGVVVVTWLASYDFFTYVDESFEPVDDTNSTATDCRCSLFAQL